MNKFDYNKTKKIKLFCFAYAGGSATIYHKWKAHLDDYVELVPVELAGRGRRIKEPFYKSMDDAIDDVYRRIRPFAAECGFAFFGHSMGSVIVYELCKRVMENDGREPVHVFVSGRYPPHICRQDEMLHTLPDNEFKDEIIKIGGTQRTVFENKEISDIFLPILKADYSLIERYEHVKSDFRLKCGITVFSGKSDNIATYDELCEWQEHTSSGINIHEFEGNHFFINDHTNEIIEIINSTLFCNREEKDTA